MSAAVTYASRLTPAGRGAIATVLVWGPSAVEHVAAAFRPRRTAGLNAAPTGHILFGNWSAVAPDGTHTGEEIVACKTATDRVEVHCHGGHAASEVILLQLQASGCRIVDWSGLPLDDRIQQDASLALASARTETAAAILLDQQRGALRRSVDELDSLVRDRDFDRASELLHELLTHGRLGCHLTKPWRVVIAGPPNVGKSSLVNAILGFDRALVVDSPGTTRDVVTALTAIDGWPVELADTAGIRSTQDSIEAAGVEQATIRLTDCDLSIVVLDATEPLGDEAARLLDALPDALVVLNKLDLTAKTFDLSRPHARTSATRGDGIAELLSQVSSRLLGRIPPAGTPMPFTPQQCDELRSVLEAIQRRDASESHRQLEHFRWGARDPGIRSS